MKTTVNITHDDSAENPFHGDTDGLGKLFVGVEKYSHLGTGSIKGMEDYIKKAGKQEHLIFSVYIYDHSGLSVSTTPFSCPWDSGQLGYIAVTNKDIREYFGWKALSTKRKKIAIGELNRQIEELNQYLSGDIWCVDVTMGDLTESCYGCYGYGYAEEVAEELTQDLELQHLARDGAQLAFAFRED